jgi:hypothetical protein
MEVRRKRRDEEKGTSGESERVERRKSKGK